MEPPILVSACLAGLATTHAGVAKPSVAVMQLVREGRAILVCPEQLGACRRPGRARRFRAPLLARRGRRCWRGRPGW